MITNGGYDLTDGDDERTAHMQEVLQDTTIIRAFHVGSSQNVQCEIWWRALCIVVAMSVFCECTGDCLKGK
jgi:hypothetical protein